MRRTRCRSRRRGVCAPSTPRRPSTCCRRSGTRRSARRRACSGAGATWWESRTIADPPDRRDGAGPKRFAVVEIDGKAEAYAIYRHRPSWDEGSSTAKLTVIEAIGATPRGTAEIWRFLLDIDWQATIEAYPLPVDHPLFFLLAEPRRMKFRMGDGLWVRLVDVGAALSARSYAQDGQLVIDVVDAFARGTRDAGSSRTARATATDDEPISRCDVTTLGSVYLGGFSFRAALPRVPRRGAARRRNRPCGRDLPPHERRSVVPRDLLRYSAPLHASGQRTLCALVFAQPALHASGRSTRPRRHPTASSCSQWPARGTITDGFGPRWGRMHLGLDIGILARSTLRAAAAGTVERAGWLTGYEGYGQVVVVDVGDGYETMYAHLSRIDVKPGAILAAGDHVGIAGCTGSCTGTHLHFELHDVGTPIDPMPFLPASR